MTSDTVNNEVISYPLRILCLLGSELLTVSCDRKIKQAKLPGLICEVC